MFSRFTFRVLFGAATETVLSDEPLLEVPFDLGEQSCTKGLDK